MMSIYALPAQLAQAATRVRASLLFSLALLLCSTGFAERLSHEPLPTGVEICFDDADERPEAMALAEPPAYMLNPGQGKRVDLYYRGLRNLLPTRLLIPDAGTVEQVYVEVVYKGKIPGTQLHGAIQATLQDGSEVTLQPNKIRGTWGQRGGAAVFSAEVGRTDRINLNFEVEEASAQSVLLYVLRRDPDSRSYQAGTYAQYYGYNTTQEFDIPLPRDNRQRDILVTLPITEITTDDRYLDFEVSAGGVRKAFRRTWPTGFDFDNECCIDSVSTVLRGVPAGADAVNIKVISPPSVGQSFVLSGILQAEVTPTCAPLDLSLPQQICTDNTVVVECASPGAGYDATWDFGPGAHPRTHRGFGTVYVMFGQAGRQEINVEVSGPDCSSTETHYVDVTTCNRSSCALEGGTVVQQPAHGNSDGIIELDMCVTCGSTPPYRVFYTYRGQQYEKGPFSMAKPQLRNLPAGTYSQIYVVDANDCQTNVTGPITLCNGGCGQAKTCPDAVCTLTGFNDTGLKRSFWLPTLGFADPRWRWADGTGNFVVSDDRNARITGRIVSIEDPSCGFEVELVLRDRRNWAEWSALGRTWKGNPTKITEDQHLTWDYYELVEGASTLKGFGCWNGTLTLTPRPADFTYGVQVGEGANDQNLSPGLSAWFAYEGTLNGRSYRGEGDINDEGTCRLTTLRANATPIISCAADYAVPCGGSPDNAPRPTVNCGNPDDYTVTSSDREIGANPRKIERTYTARGPGGPATCTQIISFGDDVPPVFTQVPTQSRMTCGQVSDQTATASDDCGAVTVEFRETEFNRTCPGNYDLRRVWTATDESGNTATAELIVHVVDEEGPEFQAPPADVVIECKEDLPDDRPMAVDGCGGDVSIDYDVTDCEAATPIYRWTGAGLDYLTEEVDYARNYAGPVEALRLAAVCGDLPAQRRRFRVDNPNAFDVYVERVEAYGQTLYAGIRLPANAQVFFFAPQQAGGNGVTVVWQDRGGQERSVTRQSSAEQCDLSDAETCTCVYTRSWTARDACGNTSTYRQKVWQRDTKAPTLRNIPADRTYTAGTPIPAPANVTATDACTNATVQYAEVTLPSASYGCDEAAVHYLYGFRSVGLPVLRLNGRPYRIGDQPLAIQENCDGTATITGLLLDAARPDAQFAVSMRLEGRRTFAEHTAQGGQADASCAQADKTGWRFYRLANGSTFSGQGANAGTELAVTGLAGQEWLQVGAGANKANCKTGFWGRLSYAATSGNFGGSQGTWQGATSTVHLGASDACDAAYTLIRIWTATDDCGNRALERQVIRVIDEEAPTFSEVTENVTIDCAEPVPSGNALAVDNATDEVRVDLDETTSGDDCARRIVRTWTATDDCGNTRTARQVVTVTDELGPTITFANPQIAALNSGDLFVVSCSDVPTIDESIASLTDNCDPNPTVTFRDEGLGQGDCATDGFRERYKCTWTATDRCGNATVFFIFVEFQDDAAPTFAQVPGPVAQSCAQGLPTAQPVANDNCTTSPNVVETQQTIAGACTDSYQVVRLWTATDECGNTATASQVVTVTDDTAPTLTDVPADVALSCADALPVAQPTATDDCDADVRLVETTETVAGACASSYTLVRLFTATDNCGNVTTAEQRVTVTDDEAPTLAFSSQRLAGVTDGQELTAPCDNVPSFDETDVTADDNCDANVAVTFVDELVGEGDCDADGYVRLFRCTWTATDDCGNVTRLQVRLRVIDEEAPAFDNVPGELTISCEQDLPTAQPVVSDNCTDASALQITETSVREDGGCPEQYRVVRTWTATDRCGNVATATQVINVSDLVRPVLAGVPPSVTISCEEALPQNLPSATDNCDAEVDVTFTDDAVDAGCPGASSITRTFVATDNCGNAATASQVITIRDLSAPTFAQVPTPVTIQCDGAVPTAQPVASDNCDQDVNVVETSSRRAGACPDGYEIVRLWTATDHCGNQATASQVVTVEDTQVPTLANVPAAVTIRCDEAVPTARPNATDNCDDDVNVAETQDTRPGACANSYVIVRLFTASDNCGNTATASQLVTVTDEVEPVFADVPAEVTIACDARVPVDLPSATDNCDGQVAVRVEERTEPGACAGTYDVVRTFRATDACGNEAVATQVVHVVDDVAPVFAYVPADAAVTCAAAIPTEQAQVTDNCDADVQVVETQDARPGACAGTFDVVRLFTATDHCGNVATASQVVSVFDDTRPVLSDVPVNLSISCAEALPTTAPTVTDDCDDDVNVALTETREDGACADSYRVLRTWIATDHCGNTASAQQVVTVQDDTAPAFASVPQDMTVSCSQALPTDAASATDDCDADVQVIETQRTEPGACAQAYRVIRIWTATDNCGNVATAQQVVTVEDREAPVFADVPAALAIACDEPLPSVGPSVSDNCDELVTVNETQRTQPGACADSYEVVRLWTATDACGNAATASQVVTVSDDAAPSFAFVPAAVTIACDAALPTEQAEASDNCDATVTVTEAQTTQAGTCAGTYSVIRTWTATDNCGNAATASQVVSVEDVIAPSFASVPQATTIECDGDVPTTQPTVTDNCDQRVSVAETARTEPGACADTYVVVRTWTATDDCGNVSTAEQRVQVEDTTTPVFTQVPPAMTLSCEDDLPTDVAAATDNCDADVNVVEDQERRDGTCAGSFSVVRTWTATDNCGNAATASQVVSFQDNTAPTFAQVPAAVTIACDAALPTDAPTASDNCDAAPTIAETQATQPGACANAYRVVRTWTATDACGNVATASQVVTVEDTQAPSFASVPAEVTIECSDALPTDMATATDNCDDAADVSVRERTEPGACADAYTVIRVFTATDNCGNTATAEQRVNVRDTQAPTFTDVPAEVTVSCDAALPITPAAATDNCDTQVTITEEQRTEPSACLDAYTVVRVFTATDNCGNTATAEQRVNVEDTTAPTFAGVPAAVTIGCEDALPTDAPVATDNCDAQVNVVETQATEPGSCADATQVVRTWTATDNCGNVATASQVVTRIDETAPTLVAVPSDVTIACDALLPTDLPVASDNCDDAPRVTETQATVPGECAGNYSVVRTFTATDACGNTATASQTVSVEDVVAPAFADVPATATISCEESLPTAAPTASDDCDTSVDIAETEEFFPGSCGGSYRVVRTWTATDDCGNVATASQLVNVEDDTEPVLADVPVDVRLSCSDALPQNLPTATDNCDSDVHVAETQQRLPGGCADSYVLVRTFTATDDCGNVATASQQVTVEDGGAPSLVNVPGQVDIACDEDLPTDQPTATDDCDADVTVVEAQATLDGDCAASYTVVRTWTATDNCGNTATASQVINVGDRSEPTFTNVPAETTVSCDAALPSDVPTATDNCDANVEIVESQETLTGGCAHAYTVVRTWIATDDCGNVATTSQRVNVVDETAPSFVSVPAAVSLSCDQAFPTSQPLATDNCDTDVAITERTDRDRGACEDSYTVLRIWTATDACGNTATATQQVTVEDTAPPVFADVPQSVSITCGEPVPDAEPTATDDCDTEVDVRSAEQRVDGPCADTYELVRTWTATDNCGNTATATQVITVIDPVAPVLTQVPPEATVSCHDPLPSGLPGATDNCDADVAVTETQETLQGPCPDSYVVIRTFTATDNCGNTDRATQRVNVLDDGEPVFTSVPPSRTVACDADPAAEEPVVSDDCDTDVAVTMTETTSGDDCASGIQLVRIWTATDNCGNTATASQTITFADDEAPVLGAIDRTMTVECDQPVPLVVPTATDNCDREVDVMHFDVREDQDCGATITRTWVASDDCGNTASEVQIIVVNDSQAPVLSGVPANTQIDCDEMMPTATVLAADNCATDVEVRLEEFETPGECPGERAVTRLWSATDDCGNVATGSQVVTITDGGVPTFADVPANVTIACTDALPTALPTATDNCSGGSALEITVDTDTEPGNCAGNYRLIRVFSATDECGNVATASQVVSIRDEVAPVFTDVPADVTLGCGDALPETNATASDNCDADVAVALAERIIAGDCADGYDVLRTWTASDACGNVATATQTISIVDDAAPVFADVPTDVTLGCNDALPTDEPTATDDCDTSVEIAVVDARLPGGSDDAYGIVRTWTATDNCGNAATATQLISVESGGEPRFTFVPADLTLACAAAIPNAEARATDDCDGDLTPVLVETREDGDCAQRYTVVRTWTATDAEGIAVTATQRITVADDEAPQFTEVPADMTLACGAEIGTFTASATDNCDASVAVSVDEVREDGDCASGYALVRTYTATDACGNAATAVQRIEFLDEEAPVFSYVPDSEEYQCGVSDPTDRPRATDNCSDDVAITFADVSPSADCSQRLQRVWTATDACGNTSTAVQQILLEDTESPVLAGVPDNLSVDLSNGGTVPAVANVTATDNCASSPDVTLVEEQVAGTGCDYTIVRTWTATDRCANTDRATQRILVTGGNALVVDATVTNRTCTAKGSIYLNLPDGGAGYQVDWADLPGSDDAADRPEVLQGTYVVSVSRNGCRNTYSYEVLDECDWSSCTFVEQGELVVVQPSCERADGVIGYPADTTGYDWTWSPDVSSGNSAEGLAPGDYRLTVTRRDSAACTRTYTVTLVDGCACEARNSVIRAEREDVCLVDNGADIAVVAVTAPVVPANFACAYLLAEAGSGSIMRTNKTGAFSVDGSATFSIHQLIYDSLALAPTRFGAGNKVSEVEALLTQGGGDICGAITVFGARVTTAQCCIEPEVVSVTSTDADCGAQNGVANVQVLGDAADFAYTWTPDLGSAANAAGNVRNSLPVGIYTVRVANRANVGCFTEATVSVSASDIDAGLPTVTAATCGAADGTANFTGAASDLNFGWSDGGTGANRDDLAAGTYTVSVTHNDATQCVETVVVTIPATADFGLSAVINNEPDCGEDDGIATIQAQGGSGDFAYDWGASATRSDLAGGTYTVRVTDRTTGCVDSVTFTLEERVAGGVAIDIEDVELLCNGVRNGTPVYTLDYEPDFRFPPQLTFVDGAGETVVFGELGVGDYCLVIRDADGCLAGSGCFTVSEPPAITVSVTATTAGCDDDGAIGLDIAGGTPPYRYDWADLPAASDPRDRTDLNQGQYTVFITDANGCTATVNNIAIGRQCGCSPQLPALAPFGDAVCLVDDEVLVGTRVLSVSTAPGITTAYLLTDAQGTVLEVSDTPEFWVDQTGTYAINGLVYDPLSFNVSAITRGSTTLADLNAQFVQGGGFLCAGLDLDGASVQVTNCASCDVAVGTLTTADPTVWCTDDGLPSVLTLDAGATRGAITYVLVDASGQVVLAQADARVNLEGLAGGAYTLYALATEQAGDAPSVGEPLLPVSGCADLSQGVSVTALTGADCDQACQVSGGVLAALTPATVCLEDLPATLSVTATGVTGTRRAFVIVDTDERIVQVQPQGGQLTVTATMLGQYQVYSLAYEDPITGLQVGRTLRNLAGCLDLSAPRSLTVGVGAGCGQPTSTDTLRFTVAVTATDTVCFVLDPGFDPATTTYMLVGATGSQGQSAFGQYVLLPNGCLVYVAGDTPGIDVDFVTVVATDGTRTDTTVFVASITSDPPTREIVDLSVVVSQSGSACPQAVPSNFANAVAELGSGGTAGSSLYGDFTVDAATGCLTYAAGTLTGSGVDTVRVLVCDAGLLACHEVVYVISVLPQGDQITRTVLQGDTLLLCAPVGLLPGTPQTPTLCADPDQGTVTFDAATNCFVYTAPLGYAGPDALCIEVCDDQGVCVQRQVSIIVLEACADFIADEAVGLNIADCDGFGSYCLPIAMSALDDFRLELDGLPYRNTMEPCDAGAGTQIFADTGAHVLVVEDLATRCTDTVEIFVGCVDCGFSTTPPVIEVDDCDETAELTLNLLQGNWGAYAFTLNGEDARDRLRAVGAQTRITVDTGLQVLIIQALDNGCQETVTVEVRCDGSPGGGSGTTLDATITVSFTDTVCVSELGLNLTGDVVSVTDVCPGTLTGGEASAAFDAATQCFTYTGLLPGVDSLCLEVCTLAGCDTVAFTVTVVPLTPSSEDILVLVGESGTYCLDTTELASPITEVFNFCPDNSGEFVSLTLDQSTYCVLYEGLEVGMEQGCYVVCNAIACDTFFINFNVADMANDLPPVAVDDRDETTKGMSVDVNILRNDTLNGPLIQVTPISLPANGNLFVVNDSTIRYTPNENFCGAVDSFQYVISNGVAFDTATVRVEVTCDELVIFSGFSPNGDGVNDVYRILGIEAFPGNKVLIFNRWGNEVYSRENYSNQPGEAFDGRWDGKTLPSGTYFYVIDLGGDEGCRSGYLQIMR